MWSSVAAVTFVEGTGGGNYIFVQNSSGNNSYVGMIGGQQEMNIAQWYREVIAHEIGHALGAEHEQSRSDRDAYVLINYANIQSGMASNFDVLSTVNYGAYDFASIMHYHRLAFSSNGQNTIQPRPAYSQYLYAMGEEENLSPLDGSGMAQRYAPVVRPTNDQFANRLALVGNKGGVTGSNGGAGKESGEPNHFGNPGGASVWYSWTAPGTGSVTFDTYGSDYDTVLAVYTGSSVTALSHIASNDDSNGTASSVTFSATAGTAYRIAVDGYGGAQGNIKLNWLSVNFRPDLSGDGQADLVWQNNSTGERCVWLMNGPEKTSQRFLPTVPTVWQIAGTADFNGDGQTDIVWQNTSNGQRHIWFMNGTTKTGLAFFATVPTQWQIAAAGDLSGDGRTDLVWQNTTSGQRVIWVMNGATKVSEHYLPSVPTAWKIAGTGDFDSDGQIDLLWQNNSTGERRIWRMNGTTKLGELSLPTISTLWQIAGTGDFNSDGKVDIVWQNISTGQRTIWLMNGNTKLGERALPTTSTQWEIRNH